MISRIVRDPYGTLIAQRYSDGSEYYYLFDGQGDVVGLEDPGTMRAAYDFCPTGNEADLASTTLTSVALGNPLRQGSEVYDDLTKDYFGPLITEDDSGTGTQTPGLIYGDDEYSSAGLDTPGVGGLGGVGGYGEGAVGGEEPAPEYTGPPVSGGSGLSSPDFVVSPSGDVISVPSGAVGPTPVRTGRGFQYTGGSGGNGLNPRVTGVRIWTRPRGIRTDMSST